MEQSLEISEIPVAPGSRRVLADMHRRSRVQVGLAGVTVTVVTISSSWQQVLESPAIWLGTLAGLVGGALLVFELQARRDRTAATWRRARGIGWTKQERLFRVLGSIDEVDTTWP